MDFKQQYANKVLELDQLNDDLTKYLTGVQTYCQEVSAEIIIIIIKNNYNNKRIIIIIIKNIYNELISPKKDAHGSLTLQKKVGRKTRLKVIKEVLNM